MNGKSWLFVIILMIACNGYWMYYSAGVGSKTPFILLPAIATIVLVGMIINEIMENWD